MAKAFARVIALVLLALSGLARADSSASAEEAFEHLSNRIHSCSPELLEDATNRAIESTGKGEPRRKLIEQIRTRSGDWSTYFPQIEKFLDEKSHD